MVSSKASTVAQYLSELTAERRKAIAAVRKVIRDNLPAGYEEGMQYGMIGYFVPLSRFPDTYNGQPLGVAALASQKSYMALYLTCVYGDPKLETWFRQAFAKAGKKLDMGKSCVRFRTLADLPLDVIGETIARVGVDELLARYTEVRATTKTGKKEAAKKAKAKAAVRTTATAAKKPAAARTSTAKKPAIKKKQTRR